MIEPAIEWATQAGPPNWLFVIAILTAPHLWAAQIKTRLTPVLDKYLPGA